MFQYAWSVVFLGTVVLASVNHVLGWLGNKDFNAVLIGVWAADGVFNFAQEGLKHVWFNVFMIAVYVYRFYRDDDDDWWDRKKRKAKDWVRSKLPALGTWKTVTE